MKRASYRVGIEWIALNDEPSEIDVVNIAGFISVCLLADLFEVGRLKVAQDVLNNKLKNEGK